MYHKLSPQFKEKSGSGYFDEGAIAREFDNDEDGSFEYDSIFGNEDDTVSPELQFARKWNAEKFELQHAGEKAQIKHRILHYKAFPHYLEWLSNTTRHVETFYDESDFAGSTMVLRTTAYDEFKEDVVSVITASEADEILSLKPGSTHIACDRGHYRSARNAGDVWLISKFEAETNLKAHSQSKQISDGIDDLSEEDLSKLGL